MDLVEWQLKGVEKRGFGDKAIGLTESPSVNKLERMGAFSPRRDSRRSGDVCMKMRRVKTPEELALSQRAYNYFSQIHAWTRDYILQHGTDLTDYKVAKAAEEFGTDLVLKDIKRDGHPHTAVGISIGIGCRTGVGTAYPHPNQFHHNRIQKGDSSRSRVGSRSGAAAASSTALTRSRPGSRVGEDLGGHGPGLADADQLSKAGAPCQEIARADPPEAARERDAEAPLPAGRPWGRDGGPSGALHLPRRRDHSRRRDDVLDGAGPFQPEGGYGYNPSDNVVVGRRRAGQGSVPKLTKEWALLNL